MLWLFLHLENTVCRPECLCSIITLCTHTLTAWHNHMMSLWPKLTTHQTRNFLFHPALQQTPVNHTEPSGFRNTGTIPWNVCPAVSRFARLLVSSLKLFLPRAEEAEAETSSLAQRRLVWTRSRVVANTSNQPRFANAFDLHFSFSIDILASERCMETKQWQVMYHFSHTQIYSTQY